MQMTFAMAALAGALALAGCGKSDGAPSAAEIKAESAKLPKQKPGRYTSLTKMTDFAIEGVGPQDADRIRREMLAINGQSRTVCVTQEEADRGFEDLVNELQAGTCKTESFAVDGNRLTAQLACTTQQGVTSKIGVSGTNTTDTAHTRLTIAQQNKAGVTMKMVMEVDSLREGDCR